MRGSYLIYKVITFNIIAMKRLLSQTFWIGIALTAALLVTGCATSGNGTSSGGSASQTSSNSMVKVTNPQIDLADYLRRIPGVHVTGSGPSSQITIRGVSTFMGSTSPLFVVNGIRMGRNFRNVYSHVNMYDVTSVEVLKGPDASTYGVEGGNGVVVINFQQ